MGNPFRILFTRLKNLVIFQKIRLFLTRQVFFLRFRLKLSHVLVGIAFLTASLYCVFQLFASIPFNPVGLPEKYDISLSEAQREGFMRKAAKLELPGKLDIREYEIRKGDNFWLVSASNHMSIDTFVGVNPWLSDLLARKGMKVLLVSTNGTFHVVRPGESVGAIASAYNVPVKKITGHNRIGLFHPVRPGQILFIPGAKPRMMTEKMREYYEKRRMFISPVGGRYTSGFGWREHPITHVRSFHPGLDIKARTGTPVCASRDGVVVTAGWVAGYGNCVVIQHKDGYMTLYGHNSALLTRPGAKVSRGQIISRAGSTGLSTAPHVHFEIRKGNKPLNPADYLW